MRRAGASQSGWTVGAVACLIALGLLAGTAGWAQAAARVATPAPVSVGGLPCDLDASGGTPCVAAYSTVRRIVSAYSGPLYVVRRASDGARLAVHAQATSGIADAGRQDRFCRRTRCTITELDDQSGEGNDLTVGHGEQRPPVADHAAAAGSLPVRIDGQRAYGLRIVPGVGYRDLTARGLAIGSEPQSVYMVTSSRDTDSRCCFDFGNAETGVRDGGVGHMDALNVSSRCVRPAPCPGRGPWVQADLEDGLFQSNAGDSADPLDPPVLAPFVTAMLKTDGHDFFALKAGDARAGPLQTGYAGVLPDVPGGDYAPLQQEGGVVLGIGGDNARGGSGEFFEGAVTIGQPSDATDATVQSEIAATGYRPARPR